MDTTISVLKCHKEALTSSVEELDGIGPDDYWDGADGVTAYLYTDSEWLHFESTMEKLTGLGIPFILNTSYDTHSITHASLFDPTGKHLVYHYDDAERSFDVQQIDELLNGSLDQQEELKKLVAEAYAKTVYPSWENQEEYGKRYRAAVLIKSL